MDRLKSFIFLLASLILPMVVFSATLAIDGYYPFGERALLASDLEIQYVDFFSWFSDVVHGEASPFFSFASGLGSNMWGVLSYYLSSPFSLLVLFFDEGQMPLFVYVISLVKIACMSLSCAVFLRVRFTSPRPIALGLSVCYSCSLWVMMQFQNTFWLDAFIILPLACLAVNRLVVSGRMRWLVICIAIAIVECWYTAYMLICFELLWLAFEHVHCLCGAGSHRDGLSLRSSVLRFVCACIVALAISMWTFLPTVVAAMGSVGGVSPQMQSRIDSALGLIASAFSGFGAYAVVGIFILVLPLFILSIVFALRALTGKYGDAVKIAVLAIVLGTVLALCLAFTFVPSLHSMLLMVAHCDISELLLSFLPGQLTSGYTPQFFAGTLTLVFAACLFLDKRISSRIKKSAAVILALMVVASWILPLEMVWCGFRHPKGFYSRTAQFTVFFLVVLAAMELNSLYGRIYEARRCREEGVSHGVRYRILSSIGSVLPILSCVFILFCIVESAAEARMGVDAMWGGATVGGLNLTLRPLKTLPGS